MPERKTLIDELESVIASGGLGRRANVLQRVTDLFVDNAGQLSGRQIALFDDVMKRLLNEIDAKAGAMFGERIAGMATAPPGIVQQLALNDSIDIAGPVLTRSERIDDDVLVQSAMTKSQDHLLAISKRRTLHETVTDVLVERGNHQVAVNIAENSGACFSEFGYTALVGRAEVDRDLAVSVWKRSDIPRQHLLTLFAAASETVRRELQSIDPGKADEIKNVVEHARNTLQSRSREASPAFAAARAHVESLLESEQLSESQIWSFARAKQFDETMVAIALMCDVPIPIVERAMTHDRCDQIMVLAKSIELSFDTVKAILALCAETIDSPSLDMDEAGVSFRKLQPHTARKTLQYYRLRMRTVVN